MEQELKDTICALKQAEELAKITSLNNTMIAHQKCCQNEFCKQRIYELEESLLKKTHLTYDLTRNLGGIELENRELKAELKDRLEALQARFDDFKEVAWQDAI